MKHPQKQHRLFLRMQVISEPGVPSIVPPGIFGSIAHAGFWGDADAVSLVPIKTNSGRGDRRGQGGDRGLRPFPLPPCRARRRDSLAPKKINSGSGDRRGQGGDRGLRPFPLPPCRARRRDSLAPKKINSGSGDPKVSKGRAESPLVASAEAKPLLREKTYFGRSMKQK